MHKSKCSLKIKRNITIVFLCISLIQYYIRTKTCHVFRNTLKDDRVHINQFHALKWINYNNLWLSVEMLLTNNTSKQNKTKQKTTTKKSFLKHCYLMQWNESTKSHNISKFLQGTDSIVYSYAHAKIEMQWSYFLTHF